MVFNRVVINKLKIIIFVVGMIIGSFSGEIGRASCRERV